MRHRLVGIVFSISLLLLSCSFIFEGHCITIDSWVDIEVISFNGENILFNLRVFVHGNYESEKIWLKIEPASSYTSDGGFIKSSVTIEIWRVISEVVYYKDTNLTIFSYFYSYNHTYYKAEPNILGLLLFPCDKHSLLLYLVPSFNTTIDGKPKICYLPSQNYEGKFQVTFTPTSDQPNMYTLRLTIQHPSDFSFAIFIMLSAILVSLYGLTIFLTRKTCFIHKKSNSTDLSHIIQVSAAIIFFVPAFIIALYSLKSPLSLVFSDIIMILLVPWNAAIIIYSLSKNLSISKVFCSLRRRLLHPRNTHE